MNLSRYTIAIFSAWSKARELNETKLDVSFIRNIEKMSVKEIRKMYYELNELDYEKIYLPNNVSKYRLLNILLSKFDRLENVLKGEIEKKND